MASPCVWQNSRLLNGLASYSAINCAASAGVRRRTAALTCSSLIPPLNHQPRPPSRWFALTDTLEVKRKLVQQAELEAEARKAREVKEAEAQAAVTVLQAKAQADAMQHTLPLKEKQIQQTRLEAEARKKATVKNAEALAEAKVIDSKAELEKRKLMSEADQDHIRKVAQADAERMQLEAAVLKENPLIIQQIIAEKLSDKVQIMMVPSDGKFFFANDGLKGMNVAPAMQR
jgi:regulator of protease activity HflC (stomatin/prohibitin superfamily)